MDNINIAKSKFPPRKRKPRKRPTNPPVGDLGYAEQVANAYADDLVEHRVKIGDLERAISNNDVAMNDLLEGARLERAEMTTMFEVKGRRNFIHAVILYAIIVAMAFGLVVLAVI